MESNPEIIVAVYENGVLRPVTPVSFTDGEKVRLRVVPQVTHGEPKTKEEKLWQDLADRGIVHPPNKAHQVDPEEKKKRQELFEKLKDRPGKPLSEIIIEDRGQW